MTAEMKNGKTGGSFFLSFLFNLFLSFRWSIPAWILLVIHFIADISIWWFVAAILIWILVIFFWMAVIGWASRCSIPDPPKENKNPYSAKNSNF